MPENITKDQHFMPQFYLKYFTNPEGKLEILNCELRKVVTSRTPKHVCNDEWFYSMNGKADDISQVIEKSFSKIEDGIAKSYEEIIQKIIGCKKITEKDKMIISTFMSMQYLRGPYMRKQLKKLDEQLIKQTTKMRFGHTDAYNSSFFDEYEKETGIKVTPEHKEEFIKSAQSGDYEIEVSNRAHLMILNEMNGFRNFLFGKEWMIYISRSSKKFITSDNPVIEIFPSWTVKIFYGPHFMQRTHQLSLTPDVLIVANEPKDLPKEFTMGKIKRKTLFDNPKDNTKILTLNFESPKHSIIYAYANNKDQLEEIIHDANLHFSQQNERLKSLILPR